MPWDKILLAAAAGGAVFFVWNAIVWMALQYHNKDFQKLADPQAVADGLKKAGAHSGFYSLPHYHDYPGGMNGPEFRERYKKGPNALIVMMPGGSCMPAKTFGLGYLLNFAQGLAAAVIYHFSRGHLTDLPKTLGFFAAIGAFAHGGALAQSVWMAFPWPNAWKTVFDGAVGFALMAVVIRLIL